jgi:hypothetical protein
MNEAGAWVHVIMEHAQATLATLAGHWHPGSTEECTPRCPAHTANPHRDSYLATLAEAATTGRGRRMVLA